MFSWMFWLKYILCNLNYHFCHFFKRIKQIVKILRINSAKYKLTSDFVLKSLWDLRSFHFKVLVEHFKKKVGIKWDRQAVCPQSINILWKLKNNFNLRLYRSQWSVKSWNHEITIGKMLKVKIKESKGWENYNL